MKTEISRLVAVIERINPSALDAIFPHGHRVSRAKARLGEPNPQPSSADHELQVASADVAHEVAQAAIAAEAAGMGSGVEMVRKAIAAWCGTPPPPPPFPWPWPEPWPRPWRPGEQEPAVDVGASQAVGAMTLASIASRMPEGELRDAFAEGSAQLLEASLPT